jgi:type IV pilus assembly protein PilM
MARSNAVWGIDIGNSSLKALRCQLDESGKRLVADAFDYIEYPKILTQPGAEPAELVNDALKQFLSRNSVRGHRVAISVAGQNGLARFIKLPPVEARKIPDIVRYEARQQIPFDLRDVIWDYQRMGGGMEEEGFVLEAEIGLFAMKREQVLRALEPFRKVGIEIDFVQLSPLCLYNFLAFDQLQNLPPPEDYDPMNPPPSVVLLSLGTDATDLVITNGYRVWQRSVPLGGNNFTKALTKELKLTFAKAEHLKRNATAAPDPKAVFQAMRSVFNDLLTEIQRSIGYFTTLDRNAKIERMIALGNAMKLPGLRRYLSQSLGLEVVRPETFEQLTGPEVLSAPAFKENSPCFGACYGLAVQALGRASLRTNLIPVELIQERLIRSKKPWAVAAAAMILLGCAISFGGHFHALSTVDETSFSSAEQQCNEVAKKEQEYRSLFSAATEQNKSVDQIGQHLVGGQNGRLRWAEMLKAVSENLPHDPPGQRPAALMERNEVHITSIDCEPTDKLEDWFTRVKGYDWYHWSEPPAAAAPAAPAPGAAAGDQPPADEGPKGDGYLVTLTGYHYHNPDAPGAVYGSQYLRDNLLAHFWTGQLQLPKSDNGNANDLEWVTLKELGIGYPVLIDPGAPQAVEIPDPDAERNRAEDKKTGGATGPAAAAGAAGAAAGRPGTNLTSPGPSMMGGPMGTGQAVKRISVRRFVFRIQFCWQPTPPTERQKKKAQLAAVQPAAAGGGPETAGTAPAGAPKTAPPGPAGALPAGGAPATPPPAAAR